MSIDNHFLSKGIRDLFILLHTSAGTRTVDPILLKVSKTLVSAFTVYKQTVIIGVYVRESKKDGERKTPVPDIGRWY